MQKKVFFLLTGSAIILGSFPVVFSWNPYATRSVFLQGPFLFYLGQALVVGVVVSLLMLYRKLDRKSFQTPPWVLPSLIAIALCLTALEKNVTFPFGPN